jgi:hypothetical protein
MYIDHTRPKSEGGRGFADIAQHITIAPDGTIWLGRNWNSPPASAVGHNGSRAAGPFMFETIGNFDAGRDQLQGKQLETVLNVIAMVQRRHGLGPEALKFHNEMSEKSCPGTAVSKAAIIAEVRKLHESMAEPAGRGSRGPFSEEHEQDEGAGAGSIRELVAEFARTAPPVEESADAELPHEDDGRAASGPGSRDARDSGLSSGELIALRPHVINLTQGRFSDDGEYKTDRSDVDAIFHHYIPAELAAARAQGRKLRLLFFAHGGLVSESNALKMASRRISWWMRNGIYPIYFIWETGLFETIGQLLKRSGSRAGRAAGRDLWDYTSDPLIEAAVRALYGPTIWGGMKRSAERASDAEGGARYAATLLRELCQNEDDVEVHALGHSAGAIFHSHFLPVVTANGGPHIRSAHLLAPAIRVDEFIGRLSPLMGTAIDHTTIFTMYKQAERDDHCANIYRKSLLYLIHHALEPETRTPILGLEVSLRENRQLAGDFGINGGGAQHGSVVFSPSDATSGRNASQARSHGGFDDDRATMESVARIILGKSDADPIIPFETAQGGRDLSTDWFDQVDWPESLRDMGGMSASVDVPKPQPFVAPGPTIFTPGSGSGRRRALCVGINDYPSAPLYGCVADANLWASSLQSLGFESPAMLLDGAATRDAIVNALGTLITTSRPGDVAVFQYSGHGTELEDVDGDETAQDDNGGKDEAICPFDMNTNGFIIDDDLAALFKSIPYGVNVTCFIDCCHSGTINRFLLGEPGGQAGVRRRARFIKATPQMQAVHRQTRQQRRGRGGNGFTRNAGDVKREVVYSACKSEQVAWESNGQGEFTLRATTLLRQGIAGITNQEFYNRVVAAFGANPAQHPQFFCPDDTGPLPLLQPLGSGRP